MTIAQGDIKLYSSNVDGSINLSAEITSATEIFASILDIENDVEKKIWVKNTNGSETLLKAKYYNVNGFVVNNTNNTPIDDTLTEIYANITPGVYSLTFPTSSSVVVTPPSGTPLSAQSIVVDGSTLNSINLLTNMPIMLAFNSGLTTADTATVTILEGSSMILLAEDSGGVAGAYAEKHTYSTGIDFGSIAPAGTDAFWMKQNVIDGVSSGTKGFANVIRGEDD